MSKNTDKDQENKKLLAENEHLKRIIAQLPVNVYWKDADDRYQGCSKLQAEVLGLSSPEDIINKKIEQLGVIEGAEEVLKNDHKVMSEQIILSEEEKLVLDNTKQVHFYLSKKAPLYNEAGEVEGLVGASVDITEQKMLELELQQATKRMEESERLNREYVAKLYKIVTGRNEKEQGDLPESIDSISEFLESIIAKVPGHIYWCDTNNVYLGCNDEQAKSAGLASRKDIVGKTNYDLPWRNQAETVNAMNDEVMKTGKTSEAEEEVEIDDKGMRTFWSKKVPLENTHDEIIGVLGVSVDITHQKELERKLQEAKEAAESANRAKTMFIEDASHNARTPLASIYGAKELFRMYKDTFDAEQQEWIDILDESVNRFQDMIERILDFSRIEGGHFKIKHEPLDLHKYVHHVVDSVNDQAKTKNITMRVEYAEDMPHNIITDEYCVNSILLNLLSNALKFTEKGSITTRVEKQDNKFLIKVTDTGCGISAEDLQHVFERFSKAKPSCKNDNQGYGLGLSTVEYMVGFLKGEVSVESTLGKGSTFVVSLPLEVAKDESTVG